MSIIDQYKQTRSQLFADAGIGPHSKFIETDGPVKKVHYLEIGSGLPLLLVHGGLSHSSEWINILKPLSEKYHLFVVDRPGHGLSDPIDYQGLDYRKSAIEFIRSFLDALGLKKTFLMGNSMGGYFSLCFALQYPDRIDKLMLIGAPAGLNKWIPPMLRLLGIRGLNRFIMKTVAKPSFSGAKTIHKQLLVADINKVSDHLLHHAWQNQSLPGAMIAHTTLLESVLNLSGWKKELLLENELSQLQMPVQFIWGDQDAFESPETGKVKADKVNNHTFKLIENAGHCPWLDQPEKCADSILRFLG